MEHGGDCLINLLGRNDPWASKRACTDSECVVCKSRSWIQSQTREAKKKGESLPKELITDTLTQCRHEGTNYCVQCLPCLKQGRQVLYRGESSRSSRQRGAEHERDLRTGTISSPFVLHAIKEHGGVTPCLIHTISRVEPKPLYRAVRESVQISNQPWGPRNFNCCQ